MVKESEHLQVGSLNILTCTGATIGRENNMGHSIVIPDLQVSKVRLYLQGFCFLLEICHLCFTYVYTVTSIWINMSLLCHFLLIFTRFLFRLILQMHCSISYDEEQKLYSIKDHSSENGTFLDDVRLSEVGVSEVYFSIYIPVWSISGRYKR